MSGITFAACASGLVVLPLDLLRSMGYVACVSVMTTVLINLTMAPALILVLKNYFVKSTAHSLRSRWWPCGRKGAYQMSQRAIYMDAKGGQRGERVVFDFTEDQEANALLDGESDAGEESINPSNRFSRITQAEARLVRSMADTMEGEQAHLGRTRSSTWYRFARRVTNRPWIAIIAVCLAAGGLGYPALVFRTTNGIKCTCAFNQPLVKDYEFVGKTFGYGRLFPWALVVVPPPTADPSNDSLAFAADLPLARRHLLAFDASAELPDNFLPKGVTNAESPSTTATTTTATRTTPTTHTTTPSTTKTTTISNTTIKTTTAKKPTTTSTKSTTTTTSPSNLLPATMQPAFIEEIHNVGLLCSFL